MSFYKTWQTKGTNKYHAKKQTVDGIKYDSQKEAGKGFELGLLKKAHEIQDFKVHIKEELRGEHGTIIGKYYCDFLITHNDGTLEYLEIKSPITATPLWKWKWNMFQDKYKDEMKNGAVKMTVEY